MDIVILEIVPFPLGVVASLVVASIAILMLLVKSVCLLTGWEHRLPSVVVESEEQKQVLVAECDSGSPIHQILIAQNVHRSQNNG